MKKMAYLMHVDWNWIKQRPHFLAEKLSDYYEMDLFFVRNKMVKGLVENPYHEGFNAVNIIKKVPYSSKSIILQNIEKKINNSIVTKIYSNNYDFIWITSPVILQFIEIKKLIGAKIIYDCMDDVLAFPQSDQIKSYLLKLEKELLESADTVFVSSNRLKEKMAQRGCGNQVFLLNNGIEPKELVVNEQERTNEKDAKGLFNIVYFGTISEWFDIDLILKLLEIHNDIRFTLIGPTEINIPKHKRIIYFGPVKHEELWNFVKKADAFIMPFKLNELVLSVDPVKVYEYIAFMKPSFVCSYGETEKFKDFVYLYNDIKDLSQKIFDAIKNPDNNTNNKQKIKDFLFANSWDSRVKVINKVIEDFNR